MISQLPQLRFLDFQKVKQEVVVFNGRKETRLKNTKINLTFNIIRRIKMKRERGNLEFINLMKDFN